MASALSLAAKGRSKNTAKRRTSVARKANTSALSRAEGNVKRLQNKLKMGSISGKATMQAGVFTVETQGALALTAYLTGRMGEDRLKIMGYDGRLAIGGLGVGYGLWQVAQGDANGNHVLALGSGVLGALVYEMGHEAGVKAGGESTGFGREVFVSPSMGRAGLRR